MAYSDKTGFDWAKIRAALDGETWEADPWNPGTECRSFYLGTVFSVMPSGKYYMPWACSNVTEEEANKDEEFMEALEKEADAIGCYVTSSEGDPCDLLVMESRDVEDEDEDEDEAAPHGDARCQDPDCACNNEEG